MKKLLMILGGIFLVLLLVVVASVAVLAIKGNKLDKESKVYAEAILPPLLSDFTTDNFISYVAPEHRGELDKAGFDKFATAINANWGHYKSFRDLKGDSLMNFGSRSHDITAKYTMIVEFEKATVNGQISLLKSSDKWSLIRIDFNQPLASVSPKNIDKKTEPNPGMKP